MIIFCNLSGSLWIPQFSTYNQLGVAVLMWSGVKMVGARGDGTDKWNDKSTLFLMDLFAYHAHLGTLVW